MAFLDEAQRRLEVLRTTANRADVATFQRTLWAALDKVPARRARGAHELWGRPRAVEIFVTKARAELARGIGRSLPLEAINNIIEFMIECAVLDVSYPDESPVRAIEFNRIADVATEAVHNLDSGNPKVDSWLRSVGAIDSEDEVTRIGLALGALRGRPLLHFVLELEVAQSLGDEDPARISRNTLTQILFNRRFEFDQLNDYDMVPGGLSHALELGLTNVPPDLDGGMETHIADDGLTDLLQVVVSTNSNATRSLVQALLDEDQNHAAAQAGSTTPITSDLGYILNISHEVRNMVGPLEYNLRRLWTQLERPTVDAAATQELRAKITTSVDRLRAFAEQSSMLAQAATPEPFDLQAVIADAVSASAPDRNGRITVDIQGAPLARLDGRRADWVQLFLNLFRNAAQVRAGKGAVWIRHEWDRAGTLHLYVDDDGLGVREEDRERIFELGVSHRGGTGMGLHIVRATVLMANGTVVCEASPEGGARFHIHLPAKAHR